MYEKLDPRIASTVLAACVVSRTPFTGVYHYPFYSRGLSAFISTSALCVRAVRPFDQKEEQIRRIRIRIGVVWRLRMVEWNVICALMYSLRTLAITT